MNELEIAADVSKSTGTPCYDAAFDAMYRACLSATGAYELLRLVGADRHLPGISHCETDLAKAIKMAEEAKAA